MRDSIDVHGVGAGIHRAAQTCGAEGKIGNETLLDFFVVVGDSEKFCFGFSVNGGFGEPTLIGCLVIDCRHSGKILSL